MRLTSRNRGTGVLLLSLVGGMVALTFASVPLYQLFCQVTGYGGTTQVAAQLPDQVSERRMTVRFNADIDPQLPWAFQPVQRQVELQVGESGLAFFRARNLASHATKGTATFNVTPQKVGPYFVKVQCFCFDEQELAPGEEMDMAVSFFVDPDIDENENLEEVKTITLSYTFFRDLDDMDRQDAELETSEARTGDLPAVELN